MNLRKFIWVELVIWLVISLFIVFTIRHYRHKHIVSNTSYQIFMPDVDGLIVGSPVKFMGVEIGYVSKIKIVENDVYVKFLITTEDLTLPQGVIATTEFCGLGGSKSLELYPPTKDSIATGKIIEVQTPTRLRDVFVLLYNMVDKLDAIVHKASLFGDKAGDINPKSEKFIDINDIQNNLNTIEKDLDVVKLNVKHTKRGK